MILYKRDNWEFEFSYRITLIRCRTVRKLIYIIFHEKYYHCVKGVHFFFLFFKRRTSSLIKEESVELVMPFFKMYFSRAFLVRNNNIYKTQKVGL